MRMHIQNDQQDLYEMVKSITVTKKGHFTEASHKNFLE